MRVAKGKKVLSFPPDKAAREEILAAVMGPSGNLRAPALLAAGALWVGYNEDLYAELRSILAG